jgi:hypothetical protein
MTVTITEAEMTDLSGKLTQLAQEVNLWKTRIRTRKFPLEVPSKGSTNRKAAGIEEKAGGTIEGRRSAAAP